MQSPQEGKRRVADADARAEEVAAFVRHRRIARAARGGRAEPRARGWCRVVVMGG